MDRFRALPEGELSDSQKLRRDVELLKDIDGAHTQTVFMLQDLIEFQLWGLRDLRKDVVLQTLTVVQFALVVMDAVLFSVLTIGSGVKQYYPFLVVYPLLALLAGLWLVELCLGPCWRAGCCARAMACRPDDRRSLYVTEVVVLLFFLLLLLLLSLFNLGWTLYQFDDDEDEGGVASHDYRQLLWVDVALSAGSLVVSLAALSRYARLLGPFCCQGDGRAAAARAAAAAPARAGADDDVEMQPVVARGPEPRIPRTAAYCVVDLQHREEDEEEEEQPLNAY
ncbi:uncharacterized protein ACA1_269820 [Acanthamoeba castellanii str. Neff]|uniref:Uncharacterized protein n=1 Tax=Acanthamoeba castellanii (strain ATCC 30010 / Neff) TaxID=1257118 RepID=L8H2V9_ACACF|nr:uncharacterized protein ACA1_269820 [Acanthamoeba castellanii str. Neff]ELR19540.1 hypothetical protein ACA1_269820 [Acanthamoeba castellanii str. Neff]